MMNLTKHGIKHIGLVGEEAGAAFLRNNGYRIVGSNYKTRFGEIDIIAEKGGFIVFAEVKTRSENRASEPREAVDYNKQTRLINTAMIFISSNNIELQPRFDVIEVFYDKNQNSVIKINHIENAFGG